MAIKIAFTEDLEMIKLYTVRGDKTVFWCVAHKDMLMELGIKESDLEAMSELELESICPF